MGVSEGVMSPSRLVALSAHLGARRSVLKRCVHRGAVVRSAQFRIGSAQP